MRNSIYQTLSGFLTLLWKRSHTETGEGRLHVYLNSTNKDQEKHHFYPCIMTRQRSSKPAEKSSASQASRNLCSRQFSMPRPLMNATRTDWSHKSKSSSACKVRATSWDILVTDRILRPRSCVRYSMVCVREMKNGVDVRVNLCSPAAWFGGRKGKQQIRDLRSNKDMADASVVNSMKPKASSGNERQKLSSVFQMRGYGITSRERLAR